MELVKSIAAARAGDPAEQATILCRHRIQGFGDEDLGLKVDSRFEVWIGFGGAPGNWRPRKQGSCYHRVFSRTPAVLRSMTATTRRFQVLNNHPPKPVLQLRYPNPMYLIIGYVDPYGYYL